MRNTTKMDMIRKEIIRTESGYCVESFIDNTSGRVLYSYDSFGQKHVPAALPIANNLRSSEKS